MQVERPHTAGLVIRPTAVLLGLGLLLALLGLSGCGNDKPESVPKPEPGQVLKIDSKQGRALLDSGRRVLLLDVRTVREYMIGHVVGAQIGDISDDERWNSRIAELDRDKPVMVYCRDSECSAEAARRLVDEGFKEVYDLGHPGMWDPKYLPIDKRGKS